MSANKTVDEVMGSVTGFDEMAIEQAFGLDVYQDGVRKPLMTLRALVFADLRHGGASDADAKNQALGLTSKQVNEYFAQDEEIDPDEPETEAGNE